MSQASQALATAEVNMRGHSPHWREAPRPEEWSGGSLRQTKLLRNSAAGASLLCFLTGNRN